MPFAYPVTPSSESFGGMAHRSVARGRRAGKPVAALDAARPPRTSDAAQKKDAGRPMQPEPPARIGLPLILFAIVAVVAVNIDALAAADAVLPFGRLADPDAYLRLDRVLDLRPGGGGSGRSVSRRYDPASISA